MLPGAGVLQKAMEPLEARVFLEMSLTQTVRVLQKARGLQETGPVVSSRATQIGLWVILLFLPWPPRTQFLCWSGK